ncbi:MAG: transposase [Mariprofundaceae bacterium]|nr:transposase [Mariprofundaceae bacterium]
MARAVIPHIPHHITQRGVRRNDVFFNDDDYKLYISLLAKSCDKHGTEVWAYCLMTNHVHLVLVPSTEDGLRATLGETHRQYTCHINEREQCRGHLWQERFASFAMDETYLQAAVRYVELNPVHAKMVKRAEDYVWSSAKAHLAGEDDKLVKVKPMLDRVENWQAFLQSDLNDAALEMLQKHGKTGRPLGDDTFLDDMERHVGRVLRAQKKGRRRKLDE